MESLYTRITPEKSVTYKPGSIRMFFTKTTFKQKLGFKQLGVINRLGPAGTHLYLGSTIKVPVKQRSSGSFTSQRGRRTYDYKVPRFDPRTVDKFLPRGGSVMRVVGVEDTEDPLAFYNFRAPPAGGDGGDGGPPGPPGPPVPENIERILRLAQPEQTAPPTPETYYGTPTISPRQVVQILEQSLQPVPMSTNTGLGETQPRVFNPMSFYQPAMDLLELNPALRIYPGVLPDS